MSRFISLLFIPQEKNNHRALLLQPSFLGIFIAIYLLNQSILNSLTVLKPGVLGYSSEITIQKVFDQTNIERQKQNLPLLHYNKVLSKSAELKAEDMFTNNYWAHNSPQGKSPWDFIKSVDYQYSIAGENLAKDFYDTESLIKAWMNSPTHKENILNNRYQEIGIAVVNGILNGVKTTLVVQHFGAPLNGEIANDSISSTLGESTAAVKNNTISPILISKIIGIIIFTLIIGVLIVDSYITLKNQTHRLTGSSAGHIGFLIIILMLLIFSQQGAIF